MKRKLLGKNKRIFILLTVLLLITAMVLSGCGVNIGFGYPPSMSNIPCAVRSNKSIFDINDVILNFYYGGRDNDGNQKWSLMLHENYERICFSVYFFDDRYSASVGSGTLLDDYRKIEGFYFIKEINAKTFTSGAYNATRYILGTKFTHHEALTVPKEAFEFDEGSLRFFIMDIYYSKKDACYWTGFSYGELLLRYKKIGENSIKIY